MLKLIFCCAQFSTSLLDLEQKGSVSSAAGDGGGGEGGVVLGTLHADVLAVDAVVDAQSAMRAVEHVRLPADALQVIQPDLPCPCSQGATWSH